AQVYVVIVIAVVGSRPVDLVPLLSRCGESDLALPSELPHPPFERRMKEHPKRIAPVDQDGSAGAAQDHNVAVIRILAHQLLGDFGGGFRREGGSVFRRGKIPRRLLWRRPSLFPPLTTLPHPATELLSPRR